MPHHTIYISGFSDNRVITSIQIRAEVGFRGDYFQSPKCINKLEEIKAKLEKVLAEYFEDYDSDSLSNHEWNLKMTQQ